MNIASYVILMEDKSFVFAEQEFLIQLGNSHCMSSNSAVKVSVMYTRCIVDHLAIWYIYGKQ